MERPNVKKGRAENFSERVELEVEEEKRSRRRSERKRERVEVSSTSGRRSQEELWWSTRRSSPE